MKSIAVLVFTMAGPLLAAEQGHEASPSLFSGDLGNIFWSLVTFAAVIFVLGKFAWGPILTALRKREDFISDSLNQAKKDREEAQARLEEIAAKIEAARAEATAIVTEARRDAGVVKQKIEADAKSEADALIDRAKREIGIATETAVKDLYEQSAVIATEIASRVIGKEVDASAHQRLIRESIEELSRLNRN